MSQVESRYTPLDELRMEYSQRRWTRERVPFEWDTLADFLIFREFQMPAECLIPNRYTVVCIDDGIETLDYRQRIIPISGSGLGEDLAHVRKILGVFPSVAMKPHMGCGKSALVLGAERAEAGQNPPTQEEIDAFAREKTLELGTELGIEVKRTLGFDDRVTRLRRPTDFHPADGAIIGLSGDFLHNLLPNERETPVQFHLVGHYYDQPSLQPIAISEARLAHAIASRAHGVGVIDRGFRYTAPMIRTRMI